MQIDIQESVIGCPRREVFPVNSAILSEGGHIDKQSSDPICAYSFSSLC